MLRHNPGDRNSRLYSCEELPTPTPHTFVPLYYLLIASLNNSLGECWHLCIKINTQWHDRTPLQIRRDPLRPEKRQDGYRGNTFERKLQDGAECFSGRVEMPNFGPCRSLPHGTLRSGFDKGRGRTLLPLSVFTSGIGGVTWTDPQHKVHYHSRD